HSRSLFDRSSRARVNAHLPITARVGTIARFIAAVNQPSVREPKEASQYLFVSQSKSLRRRSAVKIAAFNGDRVAGLVEPEVGGTLSIWRPGKGCQRCTAIGFVELVLVLSLRAHQPDLTIAGVRSIPAKSDPGAVRRDGKHFSFIMKLTRRSSQQGDFPDARS